MSTENKTVARISRITMAPDSFRVPWTTQVVNGRMSLRYRITATATVPGVDTPVEIDIYTAAGVWLKGEHTERNPLPMLGDDIEGAVSPVDFDVWADKRREFGAFPKFDAEGKFIGMMSFRVGGVEYTPPVEAGELFLSKGDGWRVLIPDGALVIVRDKDKVKTTSWTDKFTKVTHVRTHAKVVGFDMSWLSPPPQRVISVVTARAAHKRAVIDVLGEAPEWVR